MAGELVVIRTYRTDLEAEIARLSLDAAGIPSLVLSDGTAGVHPHLQFARGVRVAVREADVADALEVLGEGVILSGEDDFEGDDDGGDDGRGRDPGAGPRSA